MLIAKPRKTRRCYSSESIESKGFDGAFLRRPSRKFRKQTERDKSLYVSIGEEETIIRGESQAASKLSGRTSPEGARRTPSSREGCQERQREKIRGTGRGEGATEDERNSGRAKGRESERVAVARNKARDTYELILIGGDSGEYGLREYEGLVRFLLEVCYRLGRARVRPLHQVDPRLVFVHRVQHQLQIVAIYQRIYRPGASSRMRSQINETGRNARAAFPTTAGNFKQTRPCVPSSMLILVKRTNTLGRGKRATRSTRSIPLNTLRKNQRHPSRAARKTKRRTQRSLSSSSGANGPEDP